MMDDTDNFPYDNVEFPVRRPQPTSTGVGPAPRIHIQPSPQEKHQTSSLAPVIEMEGSELETDEKVSSFSKTSSTTSTNMSSRQASSFNQSSLLTSSTPVANQVSSSQTKTETQTSTGSGTGKFPPNKPAVVSIQQGKVVTKQPGSVMFPFERNDFNPRSQEILNKTYTDHHSYSKLYNLILKQGFELQKPLYDAQSKLRDKLTYEQLLQGMLFDGERLLLSGHWIYFTKVEFLDDSGTKEIRASLGSGRACLTNKRLLFLVAESNSDANLTPVGDTSRGTSNAYKISLSQKDDVVYQSISLSTFRSVELNISVGASAGAKVVSQKPCWNMCTCLGKKWKAAAPVSQTYNKRLIQMGICLPPWGNNSMVIMHVHPDLPLTLSRDFVSYVQTYATQLH